MKTRLIVKSQRNRVIPDPLKRKRVRRRLHPSQRWQDYESRRLKRMGAGVYLINADQGHYFEISLNFDGFLPLTCVFHATEPRELPLTARNRVEVLPQFNKLNPLQQDLAGMLPAVGSAEDRWKGLSDNQAATFYQVTVALTGCGSGKLANHIGSITRVGGSKLQCSDANGKVRTVDGWRMHVTWKTSTNIENVLKQVGFQQDVWTHPTHTDCGYETSYRESSDTDPKLQIVLNPERSGADIDLDVGADHKSAPRHVYKKLIEKYPTAADVFEVNCNG